jgi:hypothetical protein
LLVNRRKPNFPRRLVFLAVALLAIGGWMVINAVSIYDADFGAFVPLRKFAPHLTGSVDYAISAAWMIRGSLLLCAILFVVDLSQDNRWLLRLWSVIGIVAGSWALLGLLQKATGARMIFWQTGPPNGVYPFFATYYYHANAGAFLNLVLPLTAGLAVRSFVTQSKPAVRSLWVSIFVLTLAAVFANTSRMAQAIAILLLVALAFQLGPKMMRRLSGTEKNIALAGAAAILLALLAIGQASHLEQPIRRWGSLSEQIETDVRWLAARVAIRALPDAGLFGFGPGSFRVVFPIYNTASNHRAPGGWRFLHEDYLQTVLEWGWLGSALWGLLFFGGMAVAVRSLRRQKRGARSTATGSDSATARRELGAGDTEVRGKISASQRLSLSRRLYEAGSSISLRAVGSTKPEAALQGDWTPRRRLILPLAVFALGSVALHGLVDFPFQISSIQLYAATYLGLCWGSALWNTAESGKLKRGNADRVKA